MQRKVPRKSTSNGASAPDATGAGQPDDDESEDSEPEKQLEKITIEFGGNASNSHRKVTNKVSTTKYNLITWAPLSLLLQFTRAANIYFLIISILTMIPFSPKNPGSMLGTFALVLFFTMLKEAFEDSKRYKSDLEMNSRSTKILDKSTGQVKSVKWADVRVGDIVKVEKDQEIPADLLVICAPKDVVFVSTMNLDGETNLKDRELAVTSVKEHNL